MAVTRRNVSRRAATTQCAWAAVGVAATLLFVAARPSGAQQIYQWKDDTGKVHFGNQPPPGTKNVETRGTELSGAEAECDGEVKKDCQEYVHKWGKYQDSEVYRDCLAQRMEVCLKYKPRAKPTEASARFISTPALPFDPTLGDSLLCEMRCPNNCRGQVEIRADHVLKKGENYGTDRYAMEVTPQQAGSAFCSVSTPSTGVQLVLSVRRSGSVSAAVEAQ